jgi:hypothetical protein
VGGGGKQNGKQKNEIFVDILERLTVLFNAQGQVLNSTLDGCIQMKSYLAGNPELRLALNEDLVRVRVCVRVCVVCTCGGEKDMVFCLVRARVASSPSAGPSL